MCHFPQLIALCTSKFVNLLLMSLQNKDDSDAKVREAAFCALGMAMKVIGEKAAMAFLADVDPLKMAKVCGKQLGPCFNKNTSFEVYGFLL